MPSGPAFGLTEDNPNLIWSQAANHQPPAVFRAAQSELSALRPAFLRVLIDWATLAPTRGQPPQLALKTDGCARQVAPCGAYEGIREEFRAIASQQRSSGGYQVVIDIYGAPAWAANAPSGCEKPGTAPFSRPLTQAALTDYRALIGSLLGLAAQQGIEIAWWSPWNEPNDQYFISPQRALCTSRSPTLAPSVYAQLTDAMAEELHAYGGEHHLVLGDLAGYPTGSPHRTGISEFVSALPANVICMSDVWAVHAYATTRPTRASAEPVRELEQALDARGGCGPSAQIWVTEAGAGSAAALKEPNSPVPPPPSEQRQRAGCRALAAQLTRWRSDTRVKAIFQYTFREDPDFPVGLISADLSHLYPTYALWLAFSRAMAVGGPAPPLPAQCA